MSWDTGDTRMPEGGHAGWSPRLILARQTQIIYKGKDVVTGLGEVPGHPGLAPRDGDPMCVPSTWWPSDPHPGEEAAGPSSFHLLQVGAIMKMESFIKLL